MFSSIRWRIALPYTILILLTMLGLGLYLSNYVRQTYLEDIENQLQSEARLIGDVTAPEFSGDYMDPVLDLAAKHWADILGTRVTIIAPDGFVLGESDEDRMQMENHANRPEIAQALVEEQGSSIRFSHTVGYDMMYVAVRVESAGKTMGVVRISLPLKTLDDNISHLQQSILGASVIAALGALVLAALIAGRTTRRLTQLTQAVSELAAGEGAGTPLMSSTDEVGQLTAAFNRMSVQLSQQITALKSESGKLDTVMQSMTNGVLIVDQEGKIQLMNKAAAEMFGVSQDEITGASLAATLRNAAVFELWQKTLNSEATETATFETGTRFVVQGKAAPMGQSMPGSTLLLFQDISDQRRIESMRRDFISNVSHELRTPLAALKAISETLQGGALHDETAARHFLERMEIEVDSLSLMVNELLELSRIESGRVPLELKPVHPLEILRPAIERLQLQAGSAKLELVIDCSETLHNVSADSVRIQQVVTNLLHNAIKFTPGGGKITLGANLEEKSVRFFIQDTGIGIATADLRRIFERFYKVDRARSGGGTGLGLAIARHLVEAHGGKIWVESVVNEGSTFSFTVPTA